MDHTVNADTNVGKTKQGITFLPKASYIGNTLQVNKNICKLFMQSYAEQRI